jgi:hypothetical protein
MDVAMDEIQGGEIWWADLPDTFCPEQLKR